MLAAPAAKAQLQLEFNTSTNAYDEHAGTVRVPFRVRAGTAPRPASLAITYSFLAGANAFVAEADRSGANADFTDPGSGSITFAAADALAIPVAIVNDNTDESAEEFRLRIDTINGAATCSGTSGGALTFCRNRHITTIQIRASDRGTATVTGPATIAEGAAAQYTVTLSRTLAFALTLNWAVAHGGTNAADFSAAGGSVTVAANETEATFTLTTTDDTASEGDEAFTVNVAVPSYLNAGPPAATTITDDDATRTLTVTGPASITEGAAGSFNIGITGTAFTSPTAVTWTVTHGDTVDADFAAVTGSVTFPTQTTFTITAADDNFVESAEAFSVQLSVADATADGGTAFGAAASLSVADNDTAGLVIAPAMLEVPEGGEAEYTVRLATQPVDAAATVTVMVSGGAGGTVIAAVSETLTFNANNWNVGQAVAVTAHADAEVDETAMITHTVTGSGEYASVTAGNVTVTIISDAVRTLTVTGPAGGTITEGAEGSFNIGITGTAFASPTAVTWTVTHGDTVDADFAATTGSVIFPTQTSFRITPADDNFVESAEAFSVQLSVADDSADGGTAFGAAASLSVADNDTAGLVIAPAMLEVPEGGEAEYTVRLATQPVDAAATVTVMVSGGAGGTVIAAVSETLTFNANNWNVGQAVAVTAHADAEVDETAMITHTVTGSGEYASITAGNVTVTIIARATTQATHELLLPEVTRAVAGEVFGAIAERAGGVGGQLDGGAGFSLNGQSNWSGIAAGAVANADIDSKELLRGLQFALPVSAGASHGGDANLAFWGGSDYRDFSGEDGDDDWDGSVFSMRFGVDGQVRENLRAGVMLSYSDAESEYTMVDGGTETKGDYELDLTSVSPYLRWRLGGGHAWASVSYGSGEVEVKPNDGDASSNDVTMTGAAFGGGRKLLEQNGRELSVRADAFVAKSEVEGDGDANTAGIDDDLDADANRVRVALAWAYPGRLANGQLSPAFDLGLRHDGGDGRTGTGLELGGALRFHAPDVGLTLEGNARALIGHSGDHRGWGIGGLMRVQNGADGQGLAVSVAPSYGDATADRQGLWDAGLPARAGQAAARWHAEVGYGVPASMSGRVFGFGDAGLLTPYSALRVGGPKRAYRLGLRWRAARLDLDVFARRTAADNAFAVEGRLRF